MRGSNGPACCSISSTPWASAATGPSGSRTVFELAESGDPAAYGIVATAAEALAALVERVSLRLAIAGPVILAGGVLVHQPLVRGLLADRLAAIGVTDLRLLDAAPALGAVRLAEARVPLPL